MQWSYCSLPLNHRYHYSEHHMIKFCNEQGFFHIICYSIIASEWRISRPGPPVPLPLSISFLPSVVGDVGGPNVHPPQDSPKATFCYRFVMSFPIQHVARSISLINMAKMTVFKITTTQKYRNIEMIIYVTWILITTNNQILPLNMCFLGVTNKMKLFKCCLLIIQDDHQFSSWNRSWYQINWYATLILGQVTQYGNLYPYYWFG